MPTPYPTSEPGYLQKTQGNLIQIPDWILNLAAKEWAGFCGECFKQGYFTGWTNAVDQFREGKVEDVAKYVLEHKHTSTPPEKIAEIVRAIRGAQ